MLQDYAIIRESAAHLASAAEETVASLRDLRIEQEHHFTDRMLGRIEEAMNNYALKGVKWTAKTLTDKGANAQETKYGADFAGVLDIALPDYSVKKGFLAQSKRAEPGVPLTKSECNRMKGQCDDMLKLSPDSYVFLYSVTGIFVVPAISVLNSNLCDPFELYSRSVARFFEEHFECFIGDRDIATPDPKMLDSLMKRYDARRMIQLNLRPSESLPPSRTI